MFFKCLYEVFQSQSYQFQMNNMMKRYIYKTIFIGLCPLFFSACLSENPKGQIDESEAYGNADDIERNLVGDLYNYIGGFSDSQGLQGTFRGVYDWNSFSTDEQMLPVRGGDWYDGGFWQRLYYHTWEPNDVALYNTWCYLYKVVMLCNRSLYHIDKNRTKLNNLQYAVFTSEVRAVRAMMYSYLLDMFGNVPLVTGYNIPLSDVKQVPRSRLFGFVVDELQSSLPYLRQGRSNVEGVNYGRVTRPVADFMLAKLLLNAEIYADDDWTDNVHPTGSTLFFNVNGQSLNAWQATIAYCDSITNAGYILEQDPSSNFSIHNETSHENIFTIPMNKGRYANQFGYLFRSRHYAHGGALKLGSENGTSATLSTVRAFGYGTDSIDKRYKLWFYSDTVRVNNQVVRMDNGQPLVYRPLEIRPDLSGSPYEKTAGARMNKYEIDPSAYSDGRLQDNDIVLFRYADVLLMKAEAKVRNGENGTAELNEVRHRAGMPLRVKATLDNILKERLLELMWEGWRRNDLVRYGLFTKAYDFKPATGSYTSVFPIPSQAINKDGNLKQNKGYD